MRPFIYATLAVVLIVGIAPFLGGAPPQPFPSEPIAELPTLTSENEPAPHLPPMESTAPSDSPLSDPTIDQLMKLRAAIGSPLSGTLLDGDDDDQFKRFLREAIEAAPKADLLPSGEIANLREPNNLPAGDTHVAAATSLQTAAAALDLHAQSLDTDLPARAARLRALANQMRQQAAEIRELGL